MTQEELKEIEVKLEIELPKFYIETMLNYPFDENSFGYDFMLPNSSKTLETCNIFPKNDNRFIVGSDGGEHIYYIRLNGEETVYIFDLEQSKLHNSIEAKTWEDYLNNIRKIDQEILEDEKRYEEQNKNKKWWQFWI